MKNYKLLQLSLLGIVMVAFVFINPLTTVRADTEQTVIDGTVTDSHGDPVSGAAVTALCNGHSFPDTTDIHGRYSVHTDESNCKDGKTVTVTAHLGSASGAASGVVLEGGSGHDDHVTIDIILSGVIVPEFGLTTGIFAVALSAISYAYLRRKLATANSA